MIEFIVGVGVVFLGLLIIYGLGVLGLYFLDGDVWNNGGVIAAFLIGMLVIIALLISSILIFAIYLLGNSILEHFFK